MSDQANETESEPAPKAFQCDHLVFKDIPRKEGEEGISYTKRFHVEYTNPDDGTLHTGTFEARRMTLGQLVEHGVIKARLCGGMQLNAGFEIIASWMAYLEVVLVVKEKWWSPITSYDEEALHAMHDYVRLWEDSFRRNRVGTRRQDAPK